MLWNKRTHFLAAPTATVDGLAGNVLDVDRVHQLRVLLVDLQVDHRLRRPKLVTGSSANDLKEKRDTFTHLDRFLDAGYAQALELAVRQVRNSGHGGTERHQRHPITH